MGIVAKQSFKNLGITYMGFTFGAINTLLLYPYIVQDAFYGLVMFILAAGTILMPIMAFGVPQTLIKYYSSYQEQADKDRFLTLMLIAPLLGIIPVVGLAFCFHEPLAALFSGINPVVRDYFWYGVGVGGAMAYFEVFYAWCRVRLQSVFGNFMKEVFGRVGVSLLLLLLYAAYLSPEDFFKALVGLYVLRALIMKCYAYRLYKPRFSLRWPPHSRRMLKYALLVLFGGSAALILLEIDKVMLSQFAAIENVAYYGVAVYMAAVIIAPSRAMRQITDPLTAKLLNAGSPAALKTLYQKTSLTLFIVSGLCFLLIVLNLEELYHLLPEAYRRGGAVVFWIGLAKISDALLGNANAILYNSRHYKVALAFGIGFAALNVVLNALFIPQWGLKGAALASCATIIGFNLAKLWFVQVKFGCIPFTRATAQVAVILLALGLVFSVVSFPLSSLFHIVLQSILLVGLYIVMLYRFKISADVSDLLSKVLHRMKF